MTLFKKIVKIIYRPDMYFEVWSVTQIYNNITLYKVLDAIEIH